MLTHDNHVKGIRIGDTEYKVPQIADDTTILLNGSLQIYLK